MGIYLNPDSRRFYKSRNSSIYVDKSGLIAHTNAVLDTEQQYICVSRPRRFGKSMAADMLAAYYCRTNNAHEDFAGLKITNSPSFAEHANKYDVIKVDLRNFFDAGETIEQALGELKTRIYDELVEAYPDVPKLTADDLFWSVGKVYLATKRPFVVIIDEWDCPFRERETDKQGQKLYLDFLRGWFKDKPYIALAYITGILPVKRYNTESALNMFIESTMLRPGDLAEFYGFTEDEVQAVCAQFGASFDECKAWYDGYRLNGAGSIYNPRSVVLAVPKSRFESYWVQTGAVEAVSTYINMEKFKHQKENTLHDKMVALMAGVLQIIVDADFSNDTTAIESPDDALTLMAHLGYLGFERVDAQSGTVRIPNHEIRIEFERTMKRYEAQDWAHVVKAITSAEALLAATWAGDAQAVAQGVEDAHQSMSQLKYNDENSLACTVLLAYYTAGNHYALFRELPTGKGFADMVFVPKDPAKGKPAMVVELKWDKSAQGAIQQIKDKQYPASLKDWHDKILLVGINYDKQTKAHECVIEILDGLKNY